MSGTAPEQLLVQYVIMARSVQKEDFGFSILGEDVVVDCASLPSVHVLHQDTHAQGLRQSNDVDVVALFGHGLHLLVNRKENILIWIPA